MRPPFLLGFVIHSLIFVILFLFILASKIAPNSNMMAAACFTVLMPIIVLDYPIEPIVNLIKTDPLVHLGLLGLLGGFMWGGVFALFAGVFRFYRAKKSQK